MHPLYQYIVGQLAEQIRQYGIVVWYDPSGEFQEFVDELRGRSSINEVATVSLEGISVHLLTFTGSLYELRLLAEPLTSGDEPEPMLLYLPGIVQNMHGSALMELEKSGHVFFNKGLKRVARDVLLRIYTDGVIDELLAPAHVTYGDLARVLADATAQSSPSMLKAIFHTVSTHGDILAEWLAQDSFDAAIADKQAAMELVRLIQARLGLKLSSEMPLAKLRAVTQRFVLFGELRMSICGVLPAVLEPVEGPATEKAALAAQTLASLLRKEYPAEYVTMSDRVAQELHLTMATMGVAIFRSIDTFRVQEQVVLAQATAAISAGQFDTVGNLLEQHLKSFWLERFVNRQALWEVAKCMAELGKTSLEVRTELAVVGAEPDEWLSAYTKEVGWFRVDQAQRRLESWVAILEEEPDERALQVVRREYEQTTHAMAVGFSKALQQSAWMPKLLLQQQSVYRTEVEPQLKPVAYFLIDSLRYEMGLELAARLPKEAETKLTPVLTTIPSITTVGMAALLPGASDRFSVIERKSKLGSLVGDAFLPDLAARRKYAALMIAGQVDISLDELLGLSVAKLAKKIEGAQVLIVRSQEIDLAGEVNSNFQARNVMDTVINNLARAIGKLSQTGIERIVLAADHGHLFFAGERDESMRIDSPGGNTVELHRRCWIGYGGATPAGCVRVSAAALGYDSELEFVFPKGTAVFKAGGDLAYHHGGLSLQEMVVPVLTVRMPVRLPERAPANLLTVTGTPEVVATRIIKAIFQVGEGNLFADKIRIRPLLMSGCKQVGSVGMVIDGDYDQVSGCINLLAGIPVTVAFLLNDESVNVLRVVAQDPDTDAELYRSPGDIPVRLGI